VHQIAGRKIVRSVPVELNSDQSEVIRLAAAEGKHSSGGAGEADGGLDGGGGGGIVAGCVTRSGLEAAAGWRRERAEAALQELLKCGMAMIDDGDPAGGERLYWLPCVSAGAAAA
jgi:ESCRT-II complex subunit VPS22